MKESIPPVFLRNAEGSIPYKYTVLYIILINRFFSAARLWPKFIPRSISGICDWI